MADVDREHWTCADAAELYGVREWGNGYFDVSAAGEVCVDLHNPKTGGQHSLVSLVMGLKERGLTLPVLLRFSDILDSRLTLLNETFARAIEEYGYTGSYRGVWASPPLCFLTTVCSRVFLVPSFGST